MLYNICWIDSLDAFFLIPNNNIQSLPEESSADCVCIDDEQLLAGTIEPSIQIIKKTTNTSHVRTDVNNEIYPSPSSHSEFILVSASNARAL